MKKLLILTIMLGLFFTSCTKKDIQVEQEEQKRMALVYSWVAEYEVYSNFQLILERYTHVMWVDENTHEVIYTELYYSADYTRPVNNDVEIKQEGDYVDIAEYEEFYQYRQAWYEAYRD